MVRMLHSLSPVYTKENAQKWVFYVYFLTELTKQFTEKCLTKPNMWEDMIPHGTRDLFGIKWDSFQAFY